MTVVKLPNICVHNKIVFSKIFMIEYDIIIIVKSFSSKIISTIASEVNNFNNYVRKYDNPKTITEQFKWIVFEPDVFYPKSRDDP